MKLHLPDKYLQKNQIKKVLIKCWKSSSHENNISAVDLAVVVNWA
jgi:hypothetical protein